jgi:hypothetical protein
MKRIVVSMTSTINNKATVEVLSDIKTAFHKWLNCKIYESKNSVLSNKRNLHIMSERSLFLMPKPDGGGSSTQPFGPLILRLH